MSKPNANKSTSESTVARIFSDAMSRSAKTQSQIAQEMGFAKPNMVSMIKQGYTKLPIAKVQLAASCLNLDAKGLLHCCMQEYRADEWAVIRSIHGI